MTCQSWRAHHADRAGGRPVLAEECGRPLDRTASASSECWSTGRVLKDEDPRPAVTVISMTLTDRLDRRHLPVRQRQRPAGQDVLTYSWMSDALQVLRQVERPVGSARALARSTPNIDIASHIISKVRLALGGRASSWVRVKGALPGHYHYNQPCTRIKISSAGATRHFYRRERTCSWTPPGSRVRCRPR